MDRTAILIVHTGSELSTRVVRTVSAMDFNVRSESDGDAAVRLIDGGSHGLVIVHEAAALSGGMMVFDYLQNRIDRVPVIVFSDNDDIRNAVQAVRKGAHDYLTKNSTDQIIQACVDHAVNKTEKPSREISEASKRGSGTPVITCSSNMKALLNIARKVADSSATVLIQGESGTGKEVLARFIHQNSTRSKQAFVAMNCAALPENLAESELFGYEKGAFTGATQSRSGKFEQAANGTLMLDEISEMPLSLQVKLLRVLQEKEVDPIGGRKPVPIDVRVIATSNKDLAAMVHNGDFREDLYYRLRVIPLKIPPLKERKEDIPLLVKFFLEKFQTDPPVHEYRVDPAAMDQLLNWPWPGNVRELENAVERAMLIGDGATIQPEHLLLDHDLAGRQSGADPSLVGMTVKEMEQKLIGQTLLHLNENRTHAAKMLGISIRTLRNKLREYN